MTRSVRSRVGSTGRHRRSPGKCTTTVVESAIERCVPTRPPIAERDGRRRPSSRGARGFGSRSSRCSTSVGHPSRSRRDLWSSSPTIFEMRVSHETIYQSLFVQSRGALRKELTACLRTGRTRRRPQGRKDPGGYIKDMVVISDRPAEIEDRAVPGHWEGDLIVGARGKSAIVTLVERQTRYVMLRGRGCKTSAHVCAAITAQIQRLPEHLVSSLTWDRGEGSANLWVPKTPPMRLTWGYCADGLEDRIGTR